MRRNSSAAAGWAGASHRAKTRVLLVFLTAGAALHAFLVAVVLSKASYRLPIVGTLLIDARFLDLSLSLSLRSLAPFLVLGGERGLVANN